MIDDGITAPERVMTPAGHYTYGELCSGVGGLSMAIEEIFDAKPAWHCEFDDAPRKVLEARWPDVPLYRDVKALDWEAMPRVDIMGGGYPCQPFSLSGSRLGEDDPRHLWPFIAEGVGALQPKYVYFENVYGHLSKGLSQVLLDLNTLGYKVAWGVQRASDVGAPHERKRLFIMGKYEPFAEHHNGLIIPIERDMKMPQAGVAIRGRFTQSSPLESAFDKATNLPTPLANSHTGAGHQGRAGGRNLQTVVTDLLPTPTTQDGANNAGPSQYRRNTLPLNTRVMVMGD